MSYPKRQIIPPKTWIKLTDHPGWVLHEGNANEWVEVHEDGTLVFGAAMRYSTHNPHGMRLADTRRPPLVAP